MQLGHWCTCGCGPATAHVILERHATGIPTCPCFATMLPSLLLFVCIQGLLPALPLADPGKAGAAAACKWCTTCPRWQAADQRPSWCCQRPATEHESRFLHGMQGWWPAWGEMQSPGGGHPGHKTTSVLRCPRVQNHTWLRVIKSSWIALKGAWHVKRAPLSAV